MGGCTGLYWALLSHTRPYSALLGLTGPYWALIGLILHLSTNGLTNGLTDERTLRLIGLLSQPKTRDTEGVKEAVTWKGIKKSKKVSKLDLDLEEKIYPP